MHIYSPTNDENALKQFQGDVSSRFSNDKNVVMGRIMMKAGGPHPCSQFEVGMLSDLLQTATSSLKEHYACVKRVSLQRCLV